MPNVSTRQITEGVIWKQLLAYVFPILMGSFFQQMYNTVDTMVVGHALGTGALAAVGASGPILSLLNGFFLGLSSGATVILSQRCGAGDRPGLHRVLHTAMALALTLGAIVTCLGMGLAPRILRLTGTPESCMDGAVLYCRIIFGGALFSMVYNMGAGILRAMGDSRRPMLYLMVCCGVNILADILFVWVLDWGIAGAAIATVLAQGISALLCVVALLRGDADSRLRLREIRFYPGFLKNILRIGIPAGIQWMMFDTSNLIVQASVNSFGEAAVAAWVAYSKADGITWMVNGAFGVAVTTFVGQNFGARKFDRMKKTVWVCLGLSVGIIGSLGVLEFVFREQLLGLFTSDPAVIAIGAEMMAWIVLFNVLFMPMEVFSGAMRGVGYSLVPTVVLILGVCVARALWVTVLVSRFHTIAMLCLAYPVTWALCAGIFAVLYFRGTWLEKSIAGISNGEVR